MFRNTFYLVLLLIVNLLPGQSSAQSCGSDSSKASAEVCTAVELCKFATFSIGKTINWESRSFFEEFVKEAKRKNISCGVTTNNEVLALPLCESIDWRGACVGDHVNTRPISQ